METLFGCLSGMFPFDSQFPDVHPVIVGKKGAGSEHTDWRNGVIDSCPRPKELCEEGVRRYDMGSVLEYKLRWTELRLRTESLILVPRSRGR